MHQIMGKNPDAYFHHQAITQFLQTSATDSVSIEFCFHKQPPLILSDSTDFGQKEELTFSVCLNKCQNLAFVCSTCEFNLDLACTSLNSPPIIKYEPHIHLLEFFICVPIPNSYCDNCGCMIFSPFFRCMECNFYLHFNCLIKSGHTAKQQYHMHPLTFTYNVINDDFMVYTICGRLLHLKAPYYSRKECADGAHNRWMVDIRYTYSLCSTKE